MRKSKVDKRAVRSHSTACDDGTFRYPKESPKKPCHEVTEGLNRGGLNGWFTDCEVKQRRTNPLNLRLSLKFSVYILIKVHSAPLDKRSCHEVTEE